MFVCTVDLKKLSYDLNRHCELIIRILTNIPLHLILLSIYKAFIINFYIYRNANKANFTISKSRVGSSTMGCNEGSGLRDNNTPCLCPPRIDNNQNIASLIEIL